jgi:hypothetical protein
MNRSLRKNVLVNIPTSRWLAYAGASAATALGGASLAEAEIHYSGRVDTVFPANESKSASFQLDQPGDSINFARSSNGAWVDFFGVHCPKSGAVLASYPGFEYVYILRIKNRNENRYISEGPFTGAGFGSAGAFGTMVRSGQSSQRWRWLGKGTDFVGFRFNNGSGNQYGWARVHLDGRASNFSFTVVDYAWADPGEPIKPGQTSSSSSAATSTKRASAATPREGSVGLLALGAAGLALWRSRRKSH